VYTWNPYLHTCNPNLQSHHWLHQPTAIAAVTVAATIAAPTATATATPAPADAAATILLPGASFPLLSPAAAVFADLY
jgi:hypothetical protein